MGRNGFKLAPGAQVHDGRQDPEHSSHGWTMEPFERDGTLHLPAHAFHLGVNTGPGEFEDAVRNGAIITLTIARKEIALVVPVPIASARSLSKSLAEIADKLEGIAADHAAELLARASKGGAA